MRKIWSLFFGMSILALILVACSEPEDQNEPIEDDTIQQDPGVNDDENNHNESNDNDEKVNDDNFNGKDEDINDNNNGDKTVNNSDEVEEEIEETPSITLDIVSDDSLTVLVNKHNSLSENYVPEDLVTVSVPTVLENPEVRQMRKEAADALKQMFDEAIEEGIYLHARSGYRSYQTQVQLFNNYVSRHGEEAANRYSARPGQSEHQTGLVMDITSESVNFQLTEQFGDTEEGIWLRDHAHEFGFIIRYPKDMEHITGYIYEPWHIRYMGVDVAKEVYESGLTYEEFLVEKGVLDDVHTTKIETE